jgi:hypothetical protein
MRARKATAHWCIAATVAALLAGCGSASQTTSSPPASAPAAVRTHQTLTTAVATVPKKPGGKELAQQRAEARRRAAKERAAKAEEAAQQRQEAKEAAARQKEEQAKRTEEEAGSNAKKVVEIFKEEPVSVGNSEVAAITGHLISLSHKCSQSITTLAGMVNSGVEILKKEGITETPAEIAKGLDIAAPGKNVTAECQGILAALLVEIEQGNR